MTRGECQVSSDEWIGAEKNMKKKLTVLTFCAMLFSLCFSAEAQQAKKVYRVGYLSPRLGIEAREEAFRQSMRDLGYVEGQNLALEWRFAKGKMLFSRACGRVGPLEGRLCCCCRRSCDPRHQTIDPHDSDRHGNDRCRSR